MRRFEIRKVADAEAMAREAAADMVRCIRASRQGGTPLFSVALSGGRVAALFCRSIGLELVKAALPVSDIHFFWADERCVPPSDPESNFGLANQALFIPRGIPGNQIHRIRGEGSPAIEAERAGMELREVLGVPWVGFPILDFVFLGMGEDGHVASLFPDTPFQGGDRIYQAVRATKPPPERITLTYGMLIAAREVRVLIPGKAKTGALLKSINGDRTPLGRVISARRGTVIYTDIEGV